MVRRRLFFTCVKVQKDVYIGFNFNSMRTLSFFLLLSPLLGFAQPAPQPLQIKGSVKDLSPQPAWVYLLHKSGSTYVTDSVKVEEGSYAFSISMQEPDLLRLRVKYPDPADATAPRRAFSSQRDMVSVFTGPGKIKINSVDSFSHITVKGSEVHNAYLALQQQLQPYDQQSEVLFKAYSAARQQKDDAAMNRAEASMDSLDEVKKDAVYGRLLRTQPESPLALYALQSFAGWDMDPDKVEPLYNALPAATREYPSAVQLKAQLDIAKLTGIGRMAPDFTQNDTLDKPVSLSSFRGQYLLVDFWASWCGPCRQENPNVVKVFQRYKDRNFHVLGVSLDRAGQKEKWLKAIHDDHLTWTQVSDLKFWDNAVAKQYGIRAIPQNLLIDPQGKIIAKNLRGDVLEKKMAELLGL